MSRPSGSLLQVSGTFTGRVTERGVSGGGKTKVDTEESRGTEERSHTDAGVGEQPPGEWIAGSLRSALSITRCAEEAGLGDFSS
jgi:hypothetical protein